MRIRIWYVVPLLLCAAQLAVAAQTPKEFGPLDPPGTLTPAARRAVVETAGAYPFVGIKRFAQDSVLLVFDDSTLTASALRSHTWMFGPSVTKAEADGCPPEKVLGRRIARAFWAAEGRPSSMELITVAVRGTLGIDQWSAMGMNYWRAQLAGPWVGDPPAR